MNYSDDLNCQRLDDFKVLSIEQWETHEWLKYKHYAKKIPQIMFSFGLYFKNRLTGICTYGMPARMLNDGYALFGEDLKIKTYELNRLCIEECLHKNALSFFVSNTFRLLPKPCCIVSYADGNYGHHGYIYQATNFIYTGITSKELMYINKKTDKLIHPRTVVSLYGSRKKEGLPEHIEVSKEVSGKHRYLMFIGKKKDKKEMMKNLKYKVLPYPKGENKRYDSSKKVQTQQRLFI